MYWGAQRRVMGYPAVLLGSPEVLLGYLREYWDSQGGTGVPQGDTEGTPWVFPGFLGSFGGPLPAGAPQGGRTPAHSHRGGRAGGPSAARHCGATRSPPRGSPGRLGKDILLTLQTAQLTPQNPPLIPQNPLLPPQPLAVTPPPPPADTPNPPAGPSAPPTHCTQWRCPSSPPFSPDS